MLVGKTVSEKKLERDSFVVLLYPSVVVGGVCTPDNGVERDEYSGTLSLWLHIPSPGADGLSFSFFSSFFSVLYISAEGET